MSGVERRIRTIEESEPAFTKGYDERKIGVLPQHLCEQYTACLNADNGSYKSAERDFWLAVRRHFHIPGHVPLALRHGWIIVEALIGHTSEVVVEVAEAI